MVTTNHHYVEPKTQPGKTTRWKIIRPLAGAVLGFSLFLALASPYWLHEWFPESEILTALSFLDTVLLAPGLLAFFIVGLLIGTFISSGQASPALFTIIVLGASSLPLTVIGFLLGSYQKFWRIAGIIALVFYILLMLFSSPFWLSLWSA